jgi:alpha-tubulin suppressor-like RCC1 family protein
MEVRTVAAGKCCSFFVDANGALLACGAEEEGQVVRLGLREGISQTSFTAVVPTPVPSTAGVRIRAAVCYNNCNLAVSEAGQVFEWGRHLQPSTQLQFEEGISWSKRQPSVPTVMEELRNRRACQVVAGHFHSAALTEDEVLFTWEIVRDLEALPGEPMPESGYGCFVHDVGVPHRAFALKGMRITSVAVGNGFTIAVTEAGAVYSFGLSDGRLGHGKGDEEEGVFLPKRIEALDGIHVATAAADGSMLSLSPGADGCTRGGHVILTVIAWC